MPMWMMEFIIFVRKWSGFSVERRFFCAKDTFNKLGYKAKINTYTTSCIN